ncbi:hypothetical protein [Capybara microvirus Cap1_SP_137]|nr:hypothetical protein [Capybara microvirus Cap1_SP_137]
MQIHIRTSTITGKKIQEIRDFYGWTLNQTINFLLVMGIQELEPKRQREIEEGKGPITQDLMKIAKLHWVD